MKPGDRCPRCWKGKVYEQKGPALRIRVVGQAPLEATVYELARLRCNLCGDVFEAEGPEGVGEKKYDETAAAMMESSPLPPRWRHRAGEQKGCA